MGYIIEVRFNKEKSRIIKVKYQYTFKGEVKESIKTVEEMAKYILNGEDQGNGVKTKNKGKVGQDVEVFLRTVADNKESNNLENLPEF